MYNSALLCITIVFFSVSCLLISSRGEQAPWAPCQEQTTPSTWNIRAEAAKPPPWRASIRSSSASESRNTERLLLQDERIKWRSSNVILRLRVRSSSWSGEQNSQWRPPEATYYLKLMMIYKTSSWSLMVTYMLQRMIPSWAQMWYVIYLMSRFRHVQLKCSAYQARQSVDHHCSPETK